MDFQEAFISNYMFGVKMKFCHLCLFLPSERSERTSQAQQKKRKIELIQSCFRVSCFTEYCMKTFLDPFSHVNDVLSLVDLPNLPSYAFGFRVGGEGS